MSLTFREHRARLRALLEESADVMFYKHIRSDERPCPLRLAPRGLERLIQTKRVRVWRKSNHSVSAERAPRFPLIVGDRRRTRWYRTPSERNGWYASRIEDPGCHTTLVLKGIRVKTTNIFGQVQIDYSALTGTARDNWDVYHPSRRRRLVRQSAARPPAQKPVLGPTKTDGGLGLSAGFRTELWTPFCCPPEV